VTWAEVLKFCERLSWILGENVRAPTEAEFAAYLPRDGEAWLADSANGHTHPVGSSRPSSLGLYDVVGNVGEWLQRVNDAGLTSAVGGGAIVDTQAGLAGHLVTYVDRKERLRTVGFRFVVP
jgi:formylglycine-generating enzyme required for sulfatase activity